MSKIKTTILICLGLCLIVGAVASAVEMKLPKIEKKTLANGLNIYIIEQHEVPVVAMQLVIPGGTCFDTEETAGLTNLTSGLLRKGTKSRTANQISEEIDFVGGSLGAGADRNAIYATCKVLTKHLDKGMELLADIIINPVFAEEEVNRLKDQSIAGIMQAKSDPAFLRDQQFDKLLFGAHPYALSAIGTEETLLMLTADDVKNFYSKYIIPNNAFLLIVGDLQPAETFQKAEKYFAPWPAGTAPVMNFPQPPKLQGRKIVLIDKPDATQSYIALGHLGMSRLNPDVFSARVMNYILGGGGFSSRLTISVRGEEGLTYGIQSAFDFDRYDGSFSVTTFTKNESTAKAIQMILDEINKMRNEPVSAKELADTKAFYSGYIPLQFETASNIAEWVKTIYLYNLGEDYYNRYLQEVNNTTEARIQELAQKYLDTENLLIVVVGKADEVKTQLEQFGTVTVIPMMEL